MKKLTTLMLPIVFLLSVFLTACNSGNKTQDKNLKTDSSSVTTVVKDSVAQNTSNELSGTVQQKNESKPIVLVYNFHVTNRCVSCIAIEEATTKTLNTYFAAEMKQGRIKRQILNVDDEANAAISEKYQAFGSGLFLTRVFKGKEDIADLTGTGFKFARNKEEKFMEVLKNQITAYLK